MDSSCRWQDELVEDLSSVICGDACVRSNLNNFIIRTQACGFQVERYNQAVFTARWQVFFCRRLYNISHCLL